MIVNISAFAVERLRKSGELKLSTTQTLRGLLFIHMGLTVLMSFIMGYQLIEKTQEFKDGSMLIAMPPFMGIMSAFFQFHARNEPRKMLILLLVLVLTFCAMLLYFPEVKFISLAYWAGAVIGAGALGPALFEASLHKR